MRRPMNQSSFQDPAWLHAVTLTERLESLRAIQSLSDGVHVNTELAHRRLQRWRSQNPFTTDDPFAQRLAVDGLTEEEFLRLLGEPIEALHGRSPDLPSWLNELANAYSRAESQVPAGALPEAPSNQQNVSLLSLIEPLIRQSSVRLDKGLQSLVETYPELPFDARTIKSILFASLPGLYLMMLSRTLALEVNVARLQGLLKGDTPEERFNNFVAGLRQPETALPILREYPVLAR